MSASKWDIKGMKWEILQAKKSIEFYKEMIEWNEIKIRKFQETVDEWEKENGSAGEPSTPKSSP